MIFDNSKIKQAEQRLYHPLDISTIAITDSSANNFMSTSQNYNDNYEFIRKHHEYILNQIFLKDNKIALDFITNLENLDILTKVIGNTPVQDISIDERNMCNKLVYDFFIYPDAKLDIAKFNKEKIYYIALAKSVNRMVIPKISAIYPEELACLLTICRHSSRSEDKNIKRINTILMKQNEQLITEQSIVNLYLTLFDRVTPLFEGIMKDVRNKTKMTDMEQEIYGRIDLAILDILNEMPTSEMRKVLSSYAELYKLGYLKQVKFPIYSANNADYSRVIEVVDQLKKEGTIIP